MIFRMQEGDSQDDIVFNQVDLIFIGKPVEDRADEAVKYIKKYAPSFLEIEYDSNLSLLNVSGNFYGIHELEKAFPSRVSSIAIEATSLSLSEVYLLMRYFLKRAHIQLLYVEPDYYSKDKTDSSHKNRSFALSNQSGYRAIPSAVVDLSRPEVKHGVFFLGYEGYRLTRLFEEHNHISRIDCTMVFGVPPFVPTWEMNSYSPNLPVIKEFNKQNKIEYCSANNPQSTFDLLSKISKLVNFEKHEKMFIAPIGTKPCGIAAALFTAMHPGSIGLIYDHPQKTKGRSSSIGSWHVYEVLIVPGE